MDAVTIRKEATPPTRAQALIGLLLAEGQSQVEIARGVGISQASISRMLSGDQADPRSSTMRRLREYAVQTLGREAA
jgi:predicted transcriptional regulator